MELALPHLLVVDVMLPDGDGGDITELLRTAWPGIPVIVVSAASRERLDELRDLGPIVMKPFDVDEFAAAAVQAVDTPRSIDGARETGPAAGRGASAPPVAEQVRAG
jgi:DNA-binding response OmpR family regulator